MQSTTVPKNIIVLTTDRVTFDKVEQAGNGNHNCAGTTKVIFNQQFIEKVRETSIFVHWADAPAKEGWHQVDRARHQLNPISQQEATKLQWHEKLYVSLSALSAVKEQRPLLLDVDNNIDIACLSLNGGYSAGTLASVAQVEAGHEAAAPQISSALRTGK